MSKQQRVQYYELYGKFMPDRMDLRIIVHLYPARTLTKIYDKTCATTQSALTRPITARVKRSDGAAGITLEGITGSALTFSHADKASVDEITIHADVPLLHAPPINMKRRNVVKLMRDIGEALTYTPNQILSSDEWVI